MRIRGWHVEAFAGLRDATVAVDPGLTVVHGANEAGKSTSLAFLRSMLFGLPDRRRGKRFWPRDGMPLAGRLELEAGDGRLTVFRRRADREIVTLVDGEHEDAPPDALVRMLGGVDEALYATVFSFGLEELAALRTLTAPGLRERLLSVGLGTGTPIGEARRALEDGMKLLWRPRGEAPIRRLRERLQEIDARLRDARRLAASYRTLVERRAELRQTVDALGAELGDLRDVRARLDGVRERVAECRRLRAQADDARHAVRHHLNDLGAEWTDERLRAFDGSLPRRAEIRAFADRLDHARRREEVRRERHLAARDHDKELEHDAASAGMNRAVVLVVLAVLGGVLAAGADGTVRLIAAGLAAGALLVGAQELMAHRREADRRRAAAAAWSEEVGTRRSDLARARRRRRRLEKEWDAWSRAAGVPDSSPEAALEVFDVVRAALEARLAGDELEARLASHERELADVEERLGSPVRSEPELQRQLRRVDAAIGARTEARDAALRDQADADRACADIAASADIAALQQERETHRARLDELEHEWLALAVARELLDESRAEFEERRHPAVLQAAGRHFSRVTHGRYRRVLQRQDGLAVRAADGVLLETDHLSRGTAEALYICLRLALIESMGEEGVRVPILMDDVLVDLDPARAAGLAEVLGRVARSHQLLFFTCHPSTRDLLRRRAGATVVELGGAEAEI